MNGYIYGTPTVAPPPGLMLGDEWWQQLASYGLGRYIDSETVQKRQVEEVTRIGMAQNGAYYTRGQPAGLAAVGGPLVVALGVLAVAGVAYLALK